MPRPFYVDDLKDEFRHPELGWLLVDRAVTFDSWITWRHALPPLPEERSGLTSEISASITALGQALHDLHIMLPGYELLGSTPFSVPRWWDPGAGDCWSSGRRCLFRIEGHDSDAIQAAGEPQAAHLKLAPVSEHYLEATLLTIPAAVPAASRRRASLRSSAAARRRRQILLAETPDSARSAQLSAP